MIFFCNPKVFEANRFPYQSLTLVDALPIKQTDAIFYETAGEMNVFAQVLSSNYGVSPEKLPLYLGYIEERQNALISLYHNYLTSGMLTCPIACFKANEGTPFLKTKALALAAMHDWQNFNAGPIVYYDAQGTHMTIFSQNYIDSFLQVYARFLQSLELGSH